MIGDDIQAAVDELATKLTNGNIKVAKSESVNLPESQDDASYYMVFGDDKGHLKRDNLARYNPETNTLTVPNVKGNVTGKVTGNVTGNLLMNWTAPDGNLSFDVDQGCLYTSLELTLEKNSTYLFELCVEYEAGHYECYTVMLTIPDISVHGLDEDALTSIKSPLFIHPYTTYGSGTSTSMMMLVYDLTGETLDLVSNEVLTDAAYDLNVFIRYKKICGVT